MKSRWKAVDKDVKEAILLPLKVLFMIAVALILMAFVQGWITFAGISTAMYTITEKLTFWQKLGPFLCFFAGWGLAARAIKEERWEGYEKMLFEAVIGLIAALFAFILALFVPNAGTG